MDENVLNRRICAYMFDVGGIAAVRAASDHEAAILFESGQTVSCEVARWFIVIVASGIARVGPLREAVVLFLHPVGDQIAIIIHWDRDAGRALAPGGGRFVPLDGDGHPSAAYTLEIRVQMTIGAVVHRGHGDRGCAAELYGLNFSRTRPTRRPPIRALIIGRIEDQIR